MSLSARPSGAGARSEVVRSSRSTTSSTTARTVAVPCFRASRAPGRRPRLGEPADVGQRARATGTGADSAATSMSPRPRSSSRSMRTDTDCPAGAASSAPSSVSTDDHPRAQRPRAARRPRRPAAARRPRRGPRRRARRRTGRAAPTGPGSAARRARPRAARRVSRCSSSGGPAYQLSREELSTTLSPCSALIGSAHTAPSPTCDAKQSKSATMRSKTSSDQSTRSILLTASTTWRTPSRAATAAWRRVCSITPLRASTSTIATSAVEAPVTMLRVYCSCPGVSARMKRRRGVAK